METKTKSSLYLFSEDEKNVVQTPNNVETITSKLFKYSQMIISQLVEAYHRGCEPCPHTDPKTCPHIDFNTGRYTSFYDDC